MLSPLPTISSSIFILMIFSSVAIVFTLIQALLEPLRSVPGPFFARFTRLWYFREIYKGNFEYSNIELHKRHGPIVRIAPGTYSLDDADAAKVIYGLGKGFVKAPWYLAWMIPGEDSSNLFAELDPHKHNAMRRKFSSMFSMSTLISYEPFVDNCSALLMENLRDFACSRETIDLYHWLQCYAFDVIGEITFAKRFGFLDEGKDTEGVFEALDKGLVYSTLVGIFPWLHLWIFPWLPQSTSIRYVTNFTQRQIEKRRKKLHAPEKKMGDHHGPLDIASKIMLLNEKDPEKMTPKNLFEMCFTNVAAGSDTTAISLSSIMYHLLKYPSTYQKLQKEIEDAAREGRISDPITFNEAQELRYLQAVIKEAMRMHPAVGLPLLRTVPPEGAIIVGKFVPGRSTVGINAWVAHRNPKIFGPDASTWRPERWLELAAQSRTSDVEKYFFAFGMGSRTCIGKNISLLEMNKLIPQLVRNFDFVLDDALLHETADGGLQCLNRWFVKQKNLTAKVVAR